MSRRRERSSAANGLTKILNGSKDPLSLPLSLPLALSFSFASKRHVAAASFQFLSLSHRVMEDGRGGGGENQTAKVERWTIAARNSATRRDDPAPPATSASCARKKNRCKPGHGARTNGRFHRRRRGGGGESTPPPNRMKVGLRRHATSFDSVADSPRYSWLS